ncbi:MAG: phage portal protein [Rhodobacteraceae bacterium]|nr:phage portal protein [Paracoccaceae bacterium]
MAQLLRKPTSKQTRVEWERQIWVYLLLSGNAYALRVGRPAKPTSLPLLHPEGVKLRPGAYGFPEGYDWTPYGGSPTSYDESLVCHWKLTQWEHGPQGLAGEGLIRALAKDLEADFAASKLSASQSRQGRPAAIISQDPTDSAIWTKEQRDAIGLAYTRLSAENRAVMVIPVAAGRNLAVLVEAAVRNTVLQLRGVDTLKEFTERQQAAMRQASP